MANRNNKVLVPGSENALNQFKLEVAQEIGRLQFCKENNDHYKGDVPSRINGEEGGPIGGAMVKKMIEMYENGMK